jgi:hypothetical protein
VEQQDQGASADADRAGRSSTGAVPSPPSGDHPIALIEQIENATEPSRSLDVAIVKAIGWSDSRPYRREDCWREPLDFTASLDAAITLVPEGYFFAVSTHPQGAFAILAASGDGPAIRSAEAVATPALALCAAALKARGQQ